jgi:hypothetical protein
MSPSPDTNGKSRLMPPAFAAAAATTMLQCCSFFDFAAAS